MSLSREEELVYIIAAKKGDTKAMEVLIDANKNWIKYYIYRYKFNKDDIYQQAMLGFIEAVNRFDINRPNSLYNYAYSYVKSYVTNFLYYLSNIHKHSHLYRKKFVNGIIPVKEVMIDDTLVTFSEVEDLILQKQIKKRIFDILSGLDEREQDIIKRHIMNPNKETLNNISKEHNLTRERIRQIEAEALEKLRFRLKPLFRMLTI